MAAATLTCEWRMERRGARRGSSDAMSAAAAGEVNGVRALASMRVERAKMGAE